MIIILGACFKWRFLSAEKSLELSYTLHCNKTQQVTICDMVDS